jgi:hypothetical protein
VLFHDNTPALLLCLAGYAAFYLNRYRALVRFHAKRARRGTPSPETRRDALTRSDLS